MYPILSCLPDEILLRTARCTVTGDRSALVPNQIIQPGQFNHERIVVVLEKRLCF